MPAMDGTGPNGLGPMTGRGFGYCSGFYSNRPFNREYRRFNRGRRGRGMFNRTIVPEWIMSGWRDYNYSPLTEKEEKQMLEQQIQYMKENIDYMTKRIEELENLSKKGE